MAKRKIIGDWAKVDQDENEILVQLYGNLNRSLDKEMRRLFKELFKRNKGKRVIINLSQVYYIDTTIAATLAEAVKWGRKYKVELLMIDPSVPVFELFKSLKIENLLRNAYNKPISEVRE